MAQYRYTNLMEYLPVRYSATDEQKRDRQEIFDFKDGYCSLHIKTGILGKINSLGIVNKSDWCICFIPASTNYKTQRRYAALASYIERNTGIACSFTAIADVADHESGHLCGKKANPAEDFTVNANFVNGKRVILIDDIITRGSTFVSTANKLYNCGAQDVIGVFVAKTINPDWHN